MQVKSTNQIINSRHTLCLEQLSASHNVYLLGAYQGRDSDDEPDLLACKGFPDLPAWPLCTCKQYQMQSHSQFTIFAVDLRHIISVGTSKSLGDFQP